MLSYLINELSVRHSVRPSVRSQFTSKNLTFYEQIGGFCRATIFVKQTFFEDHSKVEQKPREASEANEADARKCDFLIFSLGKTWADLDLFNEVWGAHFALFSA